MYRFALRPRWIAAHVFIVGAVALCVAAGFWQLRRHDERSAFNSTLQARSTASPLPLSEALDLDDPAYRYVEASGRYDTDREVVLRSQSLEGRSGHHLLTPFVVSDGRAVIVDRGWIPFELDDPPVDEARPPSGRVEVSGVLFPPQRPFLGGPRDPATGTLQTIGRVDLDRLDAQLPYDVAPYYVRLQDQSPPHAADLPADVPLPVLDPGRNLNYAGQWFLFALVGTIGYTALLRRTARNEVRAGSGRPDNELSTQQA